MVPYQDISVGLRCQWFGQSRMVVANSGEDHKFEPMHSFHLCHPRYSVLGIIGIEVDGCGVGRKDLPPKKSILFISAVEIL